MRYPPLAIRQRTARQHERLLQLDAAPSGRHTDMSRALALSPELASLTEGLIGACQNDLELPARLRAVAALAAASVQGQDSASFIAQSAFVVGAGLAQERVDSLVAGRHAAGLTAAEAMVQTFCTELRQTGNVSPTAYEGVAATFGPAACLELTILTGCIRYLGMLLGVTRV